jgi:serpin B
MQKILLTIVIGLFIHTSIAQEVTRGNNEFAINLLQKLGKSPQNCFISPFSISTALFMTTSGARGTTEKQMLEVLKQKQNTKAQHQLFAEQTSKIEQKEKIQLGIANSIWMQQGFKFQREFKSILSNVYKSGLNECNFGSNPDLEAQKINKWVEQKTKNKIKDLIAPGILKPTTKMVLVNAIYFYGSWGKEFSKELTRESEFKQNDSTKILAKFMGREEKMLFASDKDFQLVSLPYANNEASMLVFLPVNEGNIDKELGAFTLEKYEALTKALNYKKVNLLLPKFSMETQYSLQEPLAELGMTAAFTHEADFSGMTGEKDLKIDQVIHKAFIDVTEEGTEAAGATAVVIADRSAKIDKDNTIYFRADHPFIFMIKDSATGQILFAGVLRSPAN